MLIPISIILGLVPSAVWLLIFLREDVRPHPNRLVVRTFFFGALITIPVLFFGFIAQCLFLGCPLSEGQLNILGPLLSGIAEPLPRILFLFLGVAFVEELGKFFAARTSVLRDPEFNEPVDAMLYLIIAALGFAAVENVAFVLHAPAQSAGLVAGVVPILTMRFLSATLLHSITSGIIGYTLARALFDSSVHKRMVIVGIAVATLIHGLYNGLLESGTPQTLSPQDLGNFLVSSGVVMGLLVLGAAVLWLMLQQVRALSRIHSWRNSHGRVTLLG